MKIGILDTENVAGVEHILLEEGHSVKRLIPEMRMTKEMDWLGYYGNQLSYAKNSLDVLEGVDLAIIDPATPDVYHKAQFLGVPAFGSSGVVNELERDRLFGKRVTREISETAPKSARLKTTKSWTATSVKKALKIIDKRGGMNLVMKPGDIINDLDALRTVVPYSRHDLATIVQYFKYFDRGGSVLFEERLEGVEIAIGAWFNGTNFVLPYNLNTEYKQSAEGDRGILTGEIGTVLWHEYDTSLRPWEVLCQWTPLLARSGYVGMFDINCILVPNGDLYLLEFTPRFGYPTTEVMVSAYQDLASVLMDVALQHPGSLDVDPDWIVGVCAFTHGAPLTIGIYREEPEGKEPRDLDMIIEGIHEARGIADVRALDVKRLAKDKGLFRSGFGDRALVVNGLAPTLAGARARAYEAIERIKYWSMTYRTDIGYRMESDRHQLLKHGFMTKNRFKSCGV